MTFLPCFQHHCTELRSSKTNHFPAVGVSVSVGVPVGAVYLNLGAAVRHHFQVAAVMVLVAVLDLSPEHFEPEQE